MKKLMTLVLLSTLFITGCSAAKSQTAIDIASQAGQVATTLQESISALEENYTTLGNEFTGGSLSTETLRTQATQLQNSRDAVNTMKDQITKITGAINIISTPLDNYDGNNKIINSLQDNVDRITEYKNENLAQLESLLAYYDEIITVHFEAIALHTELDAVRQRATMSGSTYLYVNSEDTLKANTLIAEINGYVAQLNDLKPKLADHLNEIQPKQQQLIKAIKDIISLLEKI